MRALLFAFLFIAMVATAQPQPKNNSRNAHAFASLNGQGPGSCSSSTANGQVMTSLNGKAACDPNLSWDSIAGLFTGAPLRIGTTSNDPLGLGIRANFSMADDAGTTAWSEWVSGGNNWFALSFGSAGGTAHAPTPTAFSQPVGQIDGRSYTGTHWEGAVAELFTSLYIGADDHPVGQWTIFTNKGGNVRYGLTLDGDYGRLLIGAAVALFKNDANCLQVLPGRSVMHLCAVDDPNHPGAARIVVAAGTDGVLHTLIDNIGTGF